LLVNRFLAAKEKLRNSGELQPKSFGDYYRVCQRVVSALGRERVLVDLGPEDFGAFRDSLSKLMGPVALAGEINRIRVVFKFAFDEGLIDRPVRYGASFKKPSRKTLRKMRSTQGPRMFEAAELRLLLGNAQGQIGAMILLGINCGFGPTDVANLPQDAIDLKGGWINYPRPKTGIERRCPLWPETIEALKAATAARPEPASPADGDLVFLTRFGRNWVRNNQKEEVSMGGEVKEYKVVTIDGVGQAFTILKGVVGLNGHRSFYALRHTFQTIGEEGGDLVAVRSIMGHVDESMSATYRERISDERLRKVADHVRNWLFGEQETK
jgi:integrase